MNKVLKCIGFFLTKLPMSIYFTNHEWRFNTENIMKVVIPITGQKLLDRWALKKGKR